MHDTPLRVSATLLIGAGGTGAILAPLLARLLLHHPAAAPSLQIVDADTYEVERNGIRQPCGPDQEGINKAEWIASLCHGQGLEAVLGMPLYANRNSVLEFLFQHEKPLVITAVDNAATRAAAMEAIDRLPVSHDFLLLNPGNADASDGSDADSGPAPILGQVMVWGRLDGQVIGVDPRPLYDDLANPPDVAPTIGSCAAQMPSAPQLLAANALSAAHTLTLLQNILDGTLFPGNAILFNGRSDRTHAIYL